MEEDANEAEGRINDSGSGRTMASFWENFFFGLIFLSFFSLIGTHIIEKVGKLT
jgi:hypothetical protein